MKNRNLDGSTLAFAQDGQLIFEEKEHTYRVEGIGEMTPVSHIVAEFFKPFDAQFWSLRKSRGNPQKAEQLREEWASKGAVASQAGTYLHKQIENYLNGETQPILYCCVGYKGKYVHLSELVDIDREWGFFKAFDAATDYTPFRTEWGVFDVETRIAGTIDLVCVRPDGTYEIYDWKRSNKIDQKEKNPWSDGLHGLEHLSDTSYVHYCLQQNLYRYLIEKNYGLKISRMNLVVLHPDYENYRIVPIPRMDQEIALMIDYVKQRLNDRS